MVTARRVKLDTLPVLHRPEIIPKQLQMHVRNGHRDALPLFLVLSDIVYIRRESERERMYIYVIELCSPPLAAFLILCQVRNTLWIS